jgi:hypothetical protein
MSVNKDRSYHKNELIDILGTPSSAGAMVNVAETGGFVFGQPAKDYDMTSARKPVPGEPEHMTWNCTGTDGDLCVAITGPPLDLEEGEWVMLRTCSLHSN